MCVCVLCVCVCVCEREREREREREVHSFMTVQSVNRNKSNLFCTVGPIPGHTHFH